MNNYCNYYNHKLNTPDYYQRNYERDLPKEEGDEWMATGKRAALVALPFLSLYKPLGLAISLSMGTARCLTHISSAVIAWEKNETSAATLEMTQLAIAVMAFAGSIFNFTFGLLLNTGQECAVSAYGSIGHLIQGDYEKAGEELLQTISSTFYLAIMLTGNLEITCASIFIQALLSFYQAQKDLIQEKYPEAASKILMGLIRCNQANTTYQMIARRNHLCAINHKFEQLLERAKKGKQVDHLLDSPLTDLDKQIQEKRVTLSDANDKEYDFGSHFHGFGKETVKGANLGFRTTVIDGKEVTELDFKVNHVFRDRLGKLINELQTFKKDELQLLLTSSNSHASNLKIEKAPFEISKTLKMSDAHKITFEGLGCLYVGGSKTYPNLYDRVMVRMDKGTNLYQLHEILSFFNLDDAMRVSSHEDIQRLKIGQLFRVFCPKEATPFERSDAFFELPIEQLQQTIIEKAPAMRQIFDDYLAKIKAREILPGRVRYGITGLADKAYDLGARALTASVTGAYTDADLYHRIASMIKMGMMSSEMRYASNLAVQGLSPSMDFYTGGADSVYTQMITKQNCIDHMRFDELNYHGKVRILISLEALETGTYQYPFDGFGSRSPSFGGYYPNRLGIQEFIANQNRHMNPGHEVMVKERIPPSMFQGLVVENAKTRNSLLDYLRKCHIVEKGNDSIERILGIDITQFIRIGKRVSEEMLTS